jgi:hypothetical protein
LKVFNKTHYFKVLSEYLSGISPKAIREMFDGFIPAEELADYVADVAKRYEDVINWTETEQM